MLTRLVLPGHGNKSAIDYGPNEVQALVNAQLSAGNPRQAGKLKTLLSTVYRMATGNIALPGDRNESETATSGNMPPIPWVPRETVNPTANVAVPRTVAKEYTPGVKNLRAYVEVLGAMTHDDSLRF